MEYKKPYLTFEQQADQLTKRGLGGNRDTLLFALESIGYYRLSGYWHIFHTDNTFHEGTTIEKCHGCFERSREPFVLHYQKKYGEGDKSKLPPIWMMVNAMDFGQMVSMYKGASVKIRADLAGRFGISSRVLESWLLSLNTVRNICAHHGRLWNRELGTKPMLPRDKQWHDPYEIPSNRMFAILVILKYLTDVISPESRWRKRLDELISEYPDIRLTSMGFLEGWEACPLWMMFTEENESAISDEPQASRKPI